MGIRRRMRRLGKPQEWASFLTSSPLIASLLPRFLSSRHGTVPSQSIVAWLGSWSLIIRGWFRWPRCLCWGPRPSWSNQILAARLLGYDYCQSQAMQRKGGIGMDDVLRPSCVIVGFAGM